MNAKIKIENHPAYQGAYQAAYRAAQASGMNDSDCHEFAAAHYNSAVLQKERADQARQIMTDALCSQPAHAPHCAAQNFANRNRSLPANHPAWVMGPPCDCWVGRLAEWLKAAN